MKKVSAVTVFMREEGMRMSMAYSEFDEQGRLTKSNSRVDRLIMDDTDLQNATAILQSAQAFLESMEE